MKCYVTGAKGFIAGYLMKHLVEKGDTIIGAIDAGDRIEIPQDTDIVYHLGALVRPPESQYMREAYFEANVGGTFDILHRTPPNAKVAIFGSAAQDHLESWYGYTKAMAELCGDAYAKFDGLKVYRLRLFGVTGVGKTGDVINEFAQQAAEKGRIEHGDIAVSRDISDVRDVVSALTRTVENEAPAMHYIGRGSATSVEYIAKWFNVPLIRDEWKVRREDAVHESLVASVKGRPIEETLKWVYDDWVKRSLLPKEM